MIVQLESWFNVQSTLVAQAKWSSLTGTSVSIDNLRPRTIGSQDLQVDLSASNTDSYLQKIFASQHQIPALQPIYVTGFWLAVDTFDASHSVGIAQFRNGSGPQVTLLLNQDGSLSVTSGGAGGSVLGSTANTPIIYPSVYYFVEMFVRFDTVVGQVAVRVWYNGAVAGTIAVNSANTAPNGANADRWNLGFMNTGFSVTTTYRFADLYVFNGVAPYNNDLTGPITVACILPDANGTEINFVPSGNTDGTSSQINYQDVNEQFEDGDTSYVRSATPGDRDQYYFGGLPATTTQILGMQVDQVAREETAGLRSLAVNMQSAGEQWTSDSFDLTTVYAWYLTIIETDPATGVPFTSLDEVQVGPQVTY